jgi:hypothetical protein
LVSGSRDAALIASLPPGAYSAVVRNSDTTGNGTALVEIYDLAPDTTARLVNLSARAFSGTGEQTAIVGVALGGKAPQQILVRAAGPALAAFGVAGALTDPQLRLVNAAGATLAQNDNWGSSVFSPEVSTAATAVGAFTFPSTSRDAATWLTMNPGSYTAPVSGTGTTTGQVLVEVYVVP